MYQPDFEPTRIPEGKYTFTVKGQPELHRRQGQREFVSPTYTFEAVDEAGNTYRHKESFVPWEERYRDLLLVMGGTPDEKGRVHGSDLDPDGKSFRATIVHEPDKKDSEKSWARIRDIQMVDADWPKGEKAQPPEDDDDLPF